MVGILLVLLSAWLLFAFLPEHRPLSVLEQVELAVSAVSQPSLAEHWMLKPGAYRAFQAIALLFGMLGLSAIVQGATYRAHKEVTCRRCKARVVGAKRAFGVRCPLANHLAERNRAATLGLVLFALLVTLAVIAFVA